MTEPWDFDATLDNAARGFADHFARANGDSGAVHERVYEYAKSEIARAVAEHDRQVAERAWDEGYEFAYEPDPEADDRPSWNPYTRKEQS